MGCLSQPCPLPWVYSHQPEGSLLCRVATWGASLDPGQQCWWGGPLPSSTCPQPVGDMSLLSRDQVLEVGTNLLLSLSPAKLSTPCRQSLQPPAGAGQEQLWGSPHPWVSRVKQQKQSAPALLHPETKSWWRGRGEVPLTARGERVSRVAEESHQVWALESSQQMLTGHNCLGKGGFVVTLSTPTPLFKIINLPMSRTYRKYV